MIRRKKSINVISILILFVLFCTSVFLPFFHNKKGKVVAEEVGNNIYAFVSQLSDKTTNGEIYVEFGVTLDYTLKTDAGVIYNKAGEVDIFDALAMADSEEYPFESAKVYFRTRNISAISELGDYEEIDQTFTVFAYNPFISLPVKVHNTGLQVGGVARQFYVEIYKVELTGLKEGYTLKQPNTTREISSKTLSTGAEFTIGQKISKYQNGDTLYNLDLEHYSYLIPHTVCQDVTTTTSFNDVKIDLGNVGGGWYNKIKYLSDNDMLKLGIRSVLSAYEDQNGIYTDNSFVGIQIFAGDSKKVGAPALEGVPSQNIFSNDSVVELSRWFAKFQSDERESLALSECFNGEFEGVTVRSLFNENVLIPSASKSVKGDSYGAGGFYDAYVGSMSGRENIYLINNLDAVFKGSTTISTRVWKYLSSKEKYYSDYLMFVPTNYRAYVESATPGKLYVDENGNKKIGLSLRFNEPVQFKKNKDGSTVLPYPSIQGKINGNAGNMFTFNYVAGDGTDTLFFEADVSNYSMDITRLSLDTTHGFENVYDFAPMATIAGSSGASQHLNVMSGNVVNGWDTISANNVPCSYDLRKPIVEFDQKIPTAVKTAHTVTVRPVNISETGKLYYGWTTGDKITPQNLTVASISPAGYQTIYSPANVTGARYLYLYAVSALDIESENYRWYGPYNFDNEAPTIDVNYTDGYVSKQFDVTVTNNTIDGFEKYADLKEVNMLVSSDANGENAKTISLLGSHNNLHQEKVTLSPYTLKAVDLGLKENEFGTFYISFSLSDTLGNQAKTPPKAYYFDLRKIFNVSLVDSNVEMDEFKTVDGKSVLGGNYYTIDWSKKDLADKEGKDAYFTLKADDSAISMGIEQFVRVTQSGENASGNTMYVSLTTMSDGSLKVVLKSKIEPGLYCLILEDLSPNSEKKSLPIYFYVTNGKTKVGENNLYLDDTGGYYSVVENTVFTNRVFQLPTSIPYYYMTASREEKKLSYTGGNGPAIFSSWAVALEYIKFCEQLDFYAATLSEDMVKDLNTTISSTNHRKAEGVTQKAEVGQVWIRYKDANWRPNSTTSNWVYYYYSEDATSLPLKESLFSQQLIYALDNITATIMEEGEEIDLVLGEYLDKYGAPSINLGQLHIAAESRTESMCGTRFESPLQYLGDSGMYYSLDATSNASLATNVGVPFGENRRIYYKGEEIKEYTLLTQDTRKTFWEYINAKGKFTILELDENGAREYCIYIDKTAPTLTLTWQKEERTQEGVQKITISQDYTANYNGLTVAGSQCSITNITDYDTLAFVAIYKYSNKGEGDLLRVYRYSDFNGQSFSLDNGKYHVQVSDRSGNSYIFVLQVESEELICNVEMVANSHVRVLGVNREEAELRRYIVYLNDRLFTTDYNERKFTESGVYRIFIEDIYGNVFDETYNLERELPAVTWRYQLADGGYATYEKDNERIKIQNIDEQNYVISTSTYLRFIPLDGCAYEIISGNPNPNKNISSGWVTLNNKTPFTMKVYYELYPETYVIYTCTVDDTAPQVSVLYEKGYYQGLELFDILTKFKNNTFVLGDNPFTPSFIGFHSDEQQLSTLYVANGQKVQSKYFKVQVSDENGVNDVKVYCNDALILTEENDFNNIYVSRRGSYKIVATDKFGNTTTFSFVNEYEERVEYFVDGVEMSTDVSFSNYFVDITDEILYEDEDTKKIIYKKAYKKQEYGNAEVAIKILSSAEIHYLITDEDGDTYHFAFVVKDGNIYTFQYVVNIVQGESAEEIENVSVCSANALSSGVIAKMENIGVAISMSKNSDGTLWLTVHSTDNTKKSYTVETRISSLDNANEMPYYFKTKICNIPSSIQFVDEEDNLITASPTIKVNKSFMVRDTLVEDIKSVEVSFSSTGNYTTYQTVYDGAYHNVVFKDEGMYHVKVVNRYGIQTDYYVVISSQFVMSATVNHLDGTTVEYSTDYTKTHDDFYSNYSIEFIVYANNVQVLDKDEAVSVIPSQQGYTTIYISTPGTYLLKVQDEYGNLLVKNVYIKAETLTIDENVLTGYNKTPNGNYTNQKLAINKDAQQGGLPNEDAFPKVGKIAFIGMLYKDKLIMVYDAISETTTDFNATQCVGVFGDGEYTVVFKDYYGNKTEIGIQYRETPTLKILRRTLNGVGAEEYALETAQSDGVWTNDSVNFVVDATHYVLTVDGMNNVTSISYANKTKDEYLVYYLDEYGFQYTFTVYLHRKDVAITPAESMSITQLSNLLVTKDSVQMHFTQNAICSYVLNNEPEKIYKEGDLLYKDGIYRFKVVDKAGNVSTYTVKKDSAVEYRLEGAGTNEVLINGSVTNSHSVRFFAENADNVYIKKVFLNNQFIQYDDEIFTQRGKWELIVADDAGNESYFRFYILYGKMDGFTYKTPYGYAINSVVWSMEDTIADATETIKEQGLRLEASKNGEYTVTMKSTFTGDVKTFTFIIDKTPPQVELIGCQPNEKTINNITLKGCSVGDTVYVYRDGTLVKTVRIDSDYTDPPTISEAGKYKLVVENEAGVQTELSFERKYIPNVAGSVLIIVLALMSVLGLFVGLIWRNHSKTDD